MASLGFRSLYIALSLLVGSFLQLSAQVNNAILVSPQLSSTVSQQNPTGSRAVYDHLLLVMVSGNSFNDLTRIAFGTLFTDTFDSNYDAYKLASNPGQPNIYTLMGTTKLAINAIPNYTVQRDIFMPFEAGTNGTFTLRFDSLRTFDRSALIFCEDRKLNTVKNIRKDSVFTFTALATDSAKRFLLHFIPPAVVTATPTTCAASAGSIHTDLSSYNFNSTVITWDYYVLKNAANQTVDSILHPNNTVSTNNLPIGNYTVTLALNGYLATMPIVVQSNGSGIVPAFNIDSPKTHLGSAVILTNASTNGATYNWDFGNGTSSTLQNPLPYTYADTGNYVITLIVSTGACSDTIRHNVRVIPNPIVVSSSTDAACGGYGTINVDFDQYDVDTPALVWDSYLVRTSLGVVVDSQSNVSVAAATTNLQPDIYTITLSRSGNTVILVDTIFQLGGVSASFTTDSIIYHVGGNVIFTSTSQGAATYNWYFGDDSISTQANPVHSYTTSGNYNVSLVIANGFCTDTVVQTLTIKANPLIVTRSIAAECNVSGSIIVDLDYLTTDSIPIIWDSYLVKNSLGALIDSQSNVMDTVITTGLAPGIYTITVIKNGNQVILIDTVSLTNPLVASFTIDSANISAGGTVVFTNTSIGAVNSAWDFGDGTPHETIPSPSHVYDSVGSYITQLVIVDGYCSDSARANINVIQVIPGIDRLSESVIRMFSHDNAITILSDLDLHNIRIDIFNVAGVLLYQANNVNLSSKPTYVHLEQNQMGLIFVSITSKGDSRTEKMVLKKD